MLVSPPSFQCVELCCLNQGETWPKGCHSAKPMGCQVKSLHAVHYFSSRKKYVNLMRFKYVGTGMPPAPNPFNKFFISGEKRSLKKYDIRRVIIRLTRDGIPATVFFCPKGTRYPDPAG